MAALSRYSLQFTLIKNSILARDEASQSVRLSGLKLSSRWANFQGLSGFHTSLTRGKSQPESAPVSDDDPALSETNVAAAESSPIDDDAKRDISRMPKKYRDRMLHALTPPPPLDYFAAMHQKAAQRNRLYAKYGRRSGIDPGTLWPSPDAELKEILEFEKEWEPSVQDMWKKLEDERTQDAKERKAKSDHVAKQMAKMPEIINQYRASLAKADEQERTQQRKHQVLMDEAREFFGYELDRSDPRFQQMILAKEEEEKKLKKTKKKELKLAKLEKFIKNA